ncbi:MAG: heparinase II/III domain-containing protein [Acholeplasmataceae bacterium]|jgi:hypothetical protein
MKKLRKIVGIIFLLMFFVVGLNTTATVRAAEPLSAVDITTTQNLGIGEKIELNNHFLPGITEVTKRQLEITSSDEDVVYIAKNTYSIYGTKAGRATIEIKLESQNIYQTFDVVVELKNILTGNAVFANLVGTETWTASNQEIMGWRLYTGNQVVDPSRQVVKAELIDGVPTVTYQHTGGDAYSNLYYIQKNVPNGHYYVTGEIKASNINKNLYYRLNQGGLIENQTLPVRGTFEWRTFESGLAEVANNQIKIELYAPNLSGTVQFRNFKIYRVLDVSFLDFTLEEESILLDHEGTNEEKFYELNPKANNVSGIEYDFTITSDDSTVIRVDPLTQKLEARKKGVSNIIVKDDKYGYSRNVYGIVGKAVDLNLGLDSTVTVDEDSFYDLEIDQKYQIYPHEKPLYGNYYITENKLRYYPNRDFNSSTEFIGGSKTLDKFTIIVYDETQGYQKVLVNVDVLPIPDEITIQEFYHSTPKGTKLTKGYVELRSRDIDEKLPGGRARTSPYSNRMTQAYKQVTTSFKNGGLTGQTAQGGVVKILNDGQTARIEDRYFYSNSKYIYGVQFEYTPVPDFTGYDTFTLVSKLGDVTVEYPVTIYVLPEHDDFKFETTDFSGTYLLSNETWITETKAAYEAGDSYLVEVIDYYKLQLANYLTKGDPATSRGPLEQLSILYKVTGEEEFFNKAWSQLDALTNKNRLGWGQDSNGFLDAAMASYSVAFAYNFLIDRLTVAQKEQVIRALYEEAFYFYDTSRFSNPNVLLHGNNHNLLINCNMALSGLAIMGYDNQNLEVKLPNGETSHINVRQVATESVKTAFNLLQIGVSNYSDSGGFIEGPAYSYYAHRNMVSLLATLHNIYGGTENWDFGLNEVEGIVNYPNYTLYTQTPNYDTYYYNEGGYSLNQPALLWYARMDDAYIPYTLPNYIAHLDQTYNAQSILWYKPGSFDNLDMTNITQTDFLLTEHELALLRKGFGDDLSSFFGMKTYAPISNSFAHKSLDAGTFEIVALGEKFVENFSHEDYLNVVPAGFWMYDYARWMYYRKQAQGHNTLIINPRDNPTMHQSPFEVSKIVNLQSGNDQSFAVADLTDVYRDQVYSYQRGIMLFDNKTNFLVQDEFELRKLSEVYFQLHTEGVITLIDDKTALITVNGKNLYAKLLTDGKFEVSEAKPLPQTIGNIGNLTLEGISKLYVHLKDIQKGTIQVMFVPSLDNNPKFDYTFGAIETWVAKDKAKATAYIDNVEFDAFMGANTLYKFNKYQNTYYIKLSEANYVIPELDITYNKNLYNIEVINAKHFGDKTIIILKDKAGQTLNRYEFYFYTDNIPNFLLIDEIEVPDIEGYLELTDDDTRSDVLFDEQTDVVFDLGKKEIISVIGVRFINFTEVNAVTISYSNDGVNYTYGGSFLSEAGTFGYNLFNLGGIEARYFKLTFNLSNETRISRVSEIKFYQRYFDVLLDGEVTRVLYQQVMEKPTDPTKESEGGVHYQFIGWYNPLTKSFHSFNEPVYGTLHLEGKYREYVTVTVVDGDQERVYEVDLNNKFAEPATNKEVEYWYHVDTNEVVDFDQPLTTSITISPKYVSTVDVAAIIIFVIVGLVVAGAVVFIVLQKKKGVKKNEKDN